MNELKFKNEDAFRIWLCQELKNCLSDSCIVVKGKNVADIILAWQCTKTPMLFFLEVKYHKQKHGRIPIGSRTGSGYQPEYLLRKIDYLERHLRWIVGEEISDSCLMLSNEDIRNFAVGGIKEGKHNNLKTSIFKTKKADLISLTNLPKQIASWVESFIKITP